MKDLKELTRPNIRALKPYSSARDEYSGAEASVFLDANENPYNTPNNRYPDPMQRELKNLIAPSRRSNRRISFWETAATRLSTWFIVLSAVRGWIM